MSGLISNSKRIKDCKFLCVWSCGEYVLHDEESHALVSSSEVTMVLKSWRMSWAGHMLDERNEKCM